MLYRPALGLACLAAVNLYAPRAAAQAAPEPVTTLAPLTSTATRTQRRADEVPATVGVVDAREIEATGARDIKDLFRNEVDLSVRAAPGRFGAAGAATGRAGNEGLNIRGLEGNQVLMLVDGIRVPGAFAFGAFATGRADYLALDATQAIEVLRGPASTQFGSDGLAGAISLRTPNPEDLLKPGKTLGGFARLAGTQVDRSAALTTAAALRSGPWSFLLLGSQRQGHETRNQGDNQALNSTRTAPNPVDATQQVVLGKLFFALDATRRLGLTAEAVRRRVDTEVYSGRAVPPVAPAVAAATAVLDLDAFDRIRRNRLSLEYSLDDLNGAWLQRARARLYGQDAQTSQRALEDRTTAADRTRNNRYGERVLGLSTQFESSLGGAWPQRLSYGVEASRTQVKALRDGTPNPSAPPPFGELFPVKPFPDTAYTVAGAFVQSELDVALGQGPGAGRLSLIPGLRFDQYRLAPSTDGYSGGAVVALAGRALTPRLGAVWKINEQVSPYAQWSKGFRAPEPGQVNNGFTNVAAGYRSEGNPNLRAEAGQSLEVGLRGRGAGAAAGLRWQVALYDNRYRDFISQIAASGAGTVADPTVFRFVNLAQARIRGAELRAEWRIDAQWSVSGASAFTSGNSTREGLTEPLDSVDPARTAIGLRYSLAAWELRADLLHAEGKARDRVRSPAPGAALPFVPAAYNVLDLGARWLPAPGWTVLASLNNVLNARYWRWSDVRGVLDTSPVKDAFTAPGRHLQLALRRDF